MPIDIRLYGKNPQKNMDQKLDEKYQKIVLETIEQASEDDQKAELEEEQIERYLFGHFRKKIKQIIQNVRKAPTR